MDEKLLGQTVGWDLVCAEGDFKELARNLFLLCEKASSSLGTPYVLTQDSMDTQEVV